jgi:hypothetical protein
MDPAEQHQKVGLDVGGKVNLQWHGISLLGNYEADGAVMGSSFAETLWRVSGLRFGT